METRICKHCGIEKDIVHFQLSFNKTKSGERKYFIRYRCHTCTYQKWTKPYVLANKEHCNQVIYKWSKEQIKKNTYYANKRRIYNEKAIKTQWKDISKEKILDKQKLHSR